jgi:hypothetical protein
MGVLYFVLGLAAYLIAEYYIHYWWLQIDYWFKGDVWSYPIWCQVWRAVVWFALLPIVFVTVMINFACFAWLGLSVARDVKHYIDS